MREVLKGLGFFQRYFWRFTEKFLGTILWHNSVPDISLELRRKCVHVYACEHSHIF